MGVDELGMGWDGMGEDGGEDGDGDGDGDGMGGMG